MSVYSYGTIGHTSMHHIFDGPWQGPWDQSGLAKADRPNIPVCDPGKRGSRGIAAPDRHKMCGRCLTWLAARKAPGGWTAPSLQEVKLSSLRFANYHRLSWAEDGTLLPAREETRAREMARTYDERLMEPLTVSVRDGANWLVDGGHRARMGMILGFSSLPARIVYLNYRGEANLFARLDARGTNKPLSALESFHALVEGGDKEHAEVQDCLELCGYAPMGRVFRGSDALLKLLHKYGRELLLRGMRVCTQVPGGAEGLWENKRIPAWFIGGIVAGLHARPEIHDVTLAKALGKHMQRIEAQRHAKFRKHTDSRYTASLMVEEYNHMTRTHKVAPL